MIKIPKGLVELSCKKSGATRFVHISVSICTIHWLPFFFYENIQMPTSLFTSECLRAYSKTNNKPGPVEWTKGFSPRQYICR